MLRADETTRTAMQTLEAGHARGRVVRRCWALTSPSAARPFRDLLARGDRLTYRDAIAVLSPDPEGTYFVYRFSDPTFVMAETVLRSLGQQPPAFPGPGAGSLRRFRTPDARAQRPPAWPRPCCSPTCSSGSCGWRARSRRRARYRCAATPISRCRLPAASFPTVVLSDAFPYIWHKRLLADEMTQARRPGRHHRDAAPPQLSRRELHRRA